MAASPRMAASASCFIAPNSTPLSDTFLRNSLYVPSPYESVVPLKDKKIRIERGLYRAGATYYACATPAGQRQARWKSLGQIGLMEARRRRDQFAAEVRAKGFTPTPKPSPPVTEVAHDWLRDQQHRV